MKINNFIKFLCVGSTIFPVCVVAAFIDLKTKVLPLFYLSDSLGITLWIAVCCLPALVCIWVYMFIAKKTIHKSLLYISIGCWFVYIYLFFLDPFKILALVLG